jgi:hypothetical protein
VEDGQTTVIILYVDDFFVSSPQRKGVDSLVDSLEKKYVSINATHGPNIEYLGMHLDFSTLNQVSITMENKIQLLLQSHSITSSVVSPATNQHYLHFTQGEDSFRPLTRVDTGRSPTRPSSHPLQLSTTTHSSWSS